MDKVRAKKYVNNFNNEKNNKGVFLIVDANNSLANNYFGIKEDIVQSHIDEGKPLNAHIYTACKRWINMIKKYNPDKIMFVFDSKEKPVFRKQIFESYKTKSKPKPLLEESIMVAKTLLEHLYIDYLCIPGFEADDVIASLAEQYKNNYYVYIWSNDKDLYQLIDNDVSLVKYNKAKYDFNIIDEHYVVAHENLSPKEYLEYKTIYGDKSNNTPGIPGLYWTSLIKQLLREHKTIDNIINIRDPNKKVKRIILNLKLHWEIVELNRKIGVLVKTIDLRNFGRHNYLKRKRSVGALFAFCKDNDINYAFFKNVLLPFFIDSHYKTFKDIPNGVIKTIKPYQHKKD